MLKAATGAAAGIYAWGIPGKSYQRALAQDDVLAQILAIPGAGGQPTEADMEQVGELCLRSTKQGAFAGQTVTFIGLNNAGSHNNIFRPLSPCLGGVHRRHDPVDRRAAGGNLLQGSAGHRDGRDRVRSAWRAVLPGKAISSAADSANAMPDWVKEQIDLDDYVKLLQAPVGTWDDVTYRISIDGDCHNFNYRSDIFSNPDLAAEWTASGGEGDWGVPTSWQQVQAQTKFLSGKQIDGTDIYGYLDVVKPGGGFSWYFYASRATAYAKNPDSPAWLFEPGDDDAVHQQPGVRPRAAGHGRVIGRSSQPTRSTPTCSSPSIRFLGGTGAMTRLVGRCRLQRLHQRYLDRAGQDGLLDPARLAGRLQQRRPASGIPLGEGQLNFAPNEAYIGWGLYVMQKAEERGVSEAAWDLAAHLGGKDISTWLAIYPSGLPAVPRTATSSCSTG